MMISRLILKNWKNFHAVDLPIASRSFVMGQNGIGKSNFLDALVFLADICRPGGGLCYALQARGGLERIKFAASKKRELVEIEVHLAIPLVMETCYHYSIGLTVDKSGSPVLAYEKIQKGGELILNRPDKNDDIDRSRLSRSYLEKAGTNGNRPGQESDIKVISNFLGSIRYLNFIPELFRHQDPFPPADIPGDPFGRKILERVAATPEKERDHNMRIIEDILRLAMPQMPKLRFAVDESGSPCLEGTFDVGRPRARHKQDLISDGTLAAFAILWSYLEDGPLLILEKPETYLNPETIHRLCLILHLGCALKNKKQLIMSTHSVEFMEDSIRRVTAQEIIMLATGSFKKGTYAFLASSLLALMDNMESGMSADEAIKDYMGPLDVRDVLLDFMEYDTDQDCDE